MKHIALGILAHVDAGKTTLSESLMFAAGKLRELGRVDKGNAFLDTDPMEKERGITIFSKQAVMNIGDNSVTLLDTPGHVDFSAEMERTLSVLDGAILVISGADGVESHTRTLWQLLENYKVPTLVFVNKMDREGTDKQNLLTEISKGLKGNFVDFSDYLNSGEEFMENVAGCSEELMDTFFESGEVSDDDIASLFEKRDLFPVFFGSALKNTGVEEFIQSLEKICDAAFSNREELCAKPFAGRVFKITRDSKEDRLSHVKIVSGTLKVRDMVGDEKVSGIRIYDGNKFENVSEAVAGQVVAVTGLNDAYPGAGLGELSGEIKALLAPVISYELILPDGVDYPVAVPKLMKLAEEQPDLSLEYDEDIRSITISLMGQVQTEILKRTIKERFGYDVSFGDRKIIYKETIDNIVEGVGHFEPLRHYAEVHLLLSPLEEGSGLVFETDCSEDILDKNWQRLIMTHLRERRHRGVLTGSQLTDVKLTVVSGRAHTKHTEGGDFRQATYRAVRQGLMQAECHLLEPYYDFRLEIPTNFVGRAMTDLERMNARDFSPEIEGDFAVLSGNGPVSTMAGYGSEVNAYTSGLGKLSLSVRGYGRCHNEEEVIESIGYNPERDVRNSADSVFCEHGSGIVVPWNEVKSRMHMPSVLSPVKELTDEQIRIKAENRAKRPAENVGSDYISLEEIDSILRSAGHSNAHEDFIAHKGMSHRYSSYDRVLGNTSGRDNSDSTAYKPSKPREPLKEYLLVDGYNVIFAWQKLNDLSKVTIDGARDALIEIMQNYQAIKGIEVIVVFDAYRVKNHAEEFLDVGNIHVVFTKTAQTADAYIERFAHENRTKYRIKVATSDGLEQVIVRGADAVVVSSRDFEIEVNQAMQNFKEIYGVE